MIFSTGIRKYYGTSALEIVRAMEKDARAYPYRGQSVRQFLVWSLARLAEKIPPREMAVSDRMAEEDLALNYLCLRDEYGAGRLLNKGRDHTGRSRSASP